MTEDIITEEEITIKRTPSLPLNWVEAKIEQVVASDVLEGQREGAGRAVGVVVFQWAHGRWKWRKP